jgi:cytolysin-activating lysine-acyltransferase
MTNKKTEKEIDDNSPKLEPFYTKDNGIILKLPREERYRLFGEVASLLMVSEFHRKYLIHDIGSVFFPPVHLNQFRIYKNKLKDPIALITWAFLSKEVEEKYLSQEYILKPQDWKSGNRIWFIDFLAPFGHMRQVSKDIKDNIFPNDCGKSVRVDSNGKIKGIYNWYGKNYRKNKKQTSKGE